MYNDGQGKFFYVKDLYENFDNTKSKLNNKRKRENVKLDIDILHNNLYGCGSDEVNMDLQKNIKINKENENQTRNLEKCTKEEKIQDKKMNVEMNKGFSIEEEGEEIIKIEPKPQETNLEKTKNPEKNQKFFSFFEDNSYYKSLVKNFFTSIARKILPGSESSSVEYISDLDMGEIGRYETCLVNLI